MKKYVEYQKKYSERIRESDKRIIEIIAQYTNDSSSVRVLDIGCSTGNLLKHLRDAFQRIKLVGGDLSELQIEECRSNSDLAGIEFHVLDVTCLRRIAEFDVVIANAVFCGLEDDDVASAAASIASALKPGGALIAFDWFHPWKQELTILEKSGNLRDGYPMHFRSYSRVRELMGCDAYESIEFSPFLIPIDLPQPALDTDYLETYTVPTAGGDRLQFRGVISQPWNHMVAIRR
jgi:SAM-dependent methyltransferase